MRHSVDIDIDIDAEPALGQQPPPHSESFGTSYGDFELMLLSDYNNNTLQRVGSVTSLTAHRGSPLTLSDLENSHDSQDFWSFEDVEDVMDVEDEDRDMAAASEVPEGSSAVGVSDGDDNEGDVAAACWRTPQTNGLHMHVLQADQLADGAVTSSKIVENRLESSKSSKIFENGFESFKSCKIVRIVRK